RAWRSVPVIHNAFAYVLLKTGVVGLLLHAAFLALLARRGPPVDGDAGTARRLLTLLVVCLVAWSVVITGVFQRHGAFAVLLLAGTLTARIDLSRSPPPARRSRAGGGRAGAAA
ncbi:MAG TPA: hypothetical protein VKU85_11245, partial [bacterium]|nr:hypothetical protein [bacterium]